MKHFASNLYTTKTIVSMQPTVFMLMEDFLLLQQQHTAMSTIQMTSMINNETPPAMIAIFLVEKKSEKS